MNKVGFVGWRGMVGSVLMQRMQEEGDFADIHPYFFTTSQLGQPDLQLVSLLMHCWMPITSKP
jgi:aspartate-semialdehyde dehydrogenase